MPRWTDPPTGEIPRLAPPPPAGDDDSDEVDVWSTFTTESPVWRDDDPVTTVMEQVPAEPRRDPSGSVDRSGSTARVPSDPSGGYDRPRDPSGSVDITGGYDAAYGARNSSGGGTGEIPAARPYAPRDRTGDVPVQPRREPGRITIGTDPSGMTRRPTDPGRRGGRPTQRSGRPAGPARTSAPPPRNMGAALIAGVVMAAVFVAALIIKPVLVLIIICALLAIAGWEFFGKITEKGYRPAVAPGLAACICAPLAAYWIGERGLPLVVAFAFMAGSIGFIGARGVESGPLPNMAVTTMGMVWIGLLGAYGALILRVSNQPLTLFGLTGANSNNIGTDTLFMVALGVAANDIGALVVGSAIGKSPLRGWISPAKTIEGRSAVRALVCCAAAGAGNLLQGPAGLRLALCDCARRRGDGDVCGAGVSAAWIGRLCSGGRDSPGRAGGLRAGLAEPELHPAWPRIGLVGGRQLRWHFSGLGWMGVLGWLIQSATLVQGGTNLVPIAFNSALAFVLMGHALWLLASGRAFSAWCLGLLCVPLAISPLLAECLGVADFLGELFWRQQGITAEGALPGRLAPNTSLALWRLSWD